MNIPDDDEGDEELERMWNQLPLEEQEAYRILSESLAPHELIDLMLQKTKIGPDEVLPTPSFDEIPSMVDWEKIEAITERRMKKLLGKT